MSRSLGPSSAQEKIFALFISIPQVKYVRREPVEHLSLHFDGFRVNEERARDAKFKDEAEQAVLSASPAAGISIVR